MAGENTKSSILHFFQYRQPTPICFIWYHAADTTVWNIQPVQKQKLWGLIATPPWAIISHCWRLHIKLRKRLGDQAWRHSQPISVELSACCVKEWLQVCEYFYWKVLSSALGTAGSKTGKILAFNSKITARLMLLDVIGTSRNSRCAFGFQVTLKQHSIQNKKRINLS